MCKKSLLLLTALFLKISLSVAQSPVYSATPTSSNKYLAIQLPLPEVENSPVKNYGWLTFPIQKIFSAPTSYTRPLGPHVGKEIKESYIKIKINKLDMLEREQALLAFWLGVDELRDTVDFNFRMPCQADDWFFKETLNDPLKDVRIILRLAKHSKVTLNSDESTTRIVFELGKLATKEAQIDGVATSLQCSEYFM